MKILTGVAVTLGVLALLAGVGVMAWGSWIAYWHYATLSTGRSAEFTNPLPVLFGAGGLLGLGGFLAGLGVGLPKRKQASEAAGAVQVPPAGASPTSAPRPPQA